MINIRKKYTKEAIPELKKRFKLSNNLEAPRIKKVVVNVGMGKFIKDSAQVDDIFKSLEVITGQRPVKTKARLSIAGFKIREGLEIGMKVTMRGKRMWDFLDRLVRVALPRVKDFSGIKKSAVDNNGNLNIGIKEHLIFPEILPEEVKNIFSLEVAVVTNTKDKETGMELFKLLGFPFEKK